VTYLSEHLLAEQRGEDARFRREVLCNYRNAVSGAGEQPLREFRVRHDGASQGVGYNKAMMLFHTLRLRLGDAAFIRALRDFHAQQKFRIATWEDLRHSFERAGNRDLGPFFAQWLDRSGAPGLSLKDVSVRRAGDVWWCGG